jgi:hypothetical protein
MAGQRLTDKTALDQQTGSGDLYMVVDVSDTTGSAAGTTKKIDSKFVIQTDKISVPNSDVIDLHTDEKILVAALSGYVITPITITALVTSGGSDESSNKNLYIGFDDSSDVNYWDTASRFYNGFSTNHSYIFGGNQAGGGVRTTSIVNTPLVIWSSGQFTGNWSMDMYVTYCYTKII